MNTENHVHIGGCRLTLTNLDKVFWPNEGFTKKDLLKYYITLAPVLLKYTRNRPLVFTRYPDGISGNSFYQKNVSQPRPPFVHTKTINSTEYVLGNNLQTLVWMANLACLEIHLWHSTINQLGCPDFAIFDLDPMENTSFVDTLSLALVLKNLLAEFNLEAYPKTSGATGLQVYLPVKPIYSYQEILRLVEFFCRTIAAAHPYIATVERLTAKRKGRVYLDYLQMVRGKTIIAPYSLRPLPGAPVSTPVTWQEVAAKNIRPQQFTIRTLPSRLNSNGDIFQEVLQKPQDLANILKTMEKVLRKKY